MRFLITFSYDGTNFNGFESQPDYRTIEDEINKVLRYINNDESTHIVASGRTDKGVHANNQVGHVDINVDITEYKLKSAMNSLLPNDIHVKSTGIVDNNFHARYMVKEKVYKYKLNMGEYNPIERNYVYQFNKKLDINKMNEAIKSFIGVHNFKSFTPTKDKKDNYVREITNAYIEESEDILTFTFIGKGFIKYQVRNMVGLLIQIGLGKKDKDCIGEILDRENRSQGFRTAHPEGLYLDSVRY